MRRTVSFMPARCPWATFAWPSFFQPSKLHRSAKWSTSHHPALCRVCSYSLPGLPRPRITFIGNVSSAERDDGSAPEGRSRLVSAARKSRILLLLGFVFLRLADQLGLGH